MEIECENCVTIHNWQDYCLNLYFNKFTENNLQNVHKTLIWKKVILFAKRIIN